MPGVLWCSVPCCNHIKNPPAVPKRANPELHKAHGQLKNPLTCCVPALADSQVTQNYMPLHLKAEPHGKKVAPNCRSPPHQTYLVPALTLPSANLSILGAPALGSLDASLRGGHDVPPGILAASQRRPLQRLQP